MTELQMKNRFLDLHGAYRRAKAEYELASHAVESCCDEVATPLAQAHDDALVAFLFHPARTSNELRWKLDICCEERIWELWHRLPEAMGVLAADAARLAKAA